MTGPLYLLLAPLFNQCDEVTKMLDRVTSFIISFYCIGAKVFECSTNATDIVLLKVEAANFTQNNHIHAHADAERYHGKGSHITKCYPQC